MPSSDPTVWTIVVAAGSGVRFGSRKQNELLGSRRVLDWAISAARSVSKGVVVAVHPDDVDSVEDRADAVVAGGSTRSASVRAALTRIPPEASIIVIHDAARPLAPVSLFESVVAAIVAGADGAVPGVAISDTVKRVREGVVETTIDRTGLMAVQTPQAFRADRLREAHRDQSDATDDSGLVEAIGGRVVVVAGDPANAKLTVLDDLVQARQRLGDT